MGVCVVCCVWRGRRKAWQEGPAACSGEQYARQKGCGTEGPTNKLPRCRLMCCAHCGGGGVAGARRVHTLLSAGSASLSRDKQLHKTCQVG